jgi:capsular polysaccharide export protein
MHYRGSMAALPHWLEVQMRAKEIDVVLLFGDCRPIHQAAYVVATRLGLEVGVFEEGYVRPDYVTLERFGVNGYSRLTRLPEEFQTEVPRVPPPRPVGRTYWWMVWWGFLYFTIGGLGKWLYPRYEHHRPLSILEALPWIRSVWRKLWYRWTERGVEERLTTYFGNRYFLLPLQVYNDAQVKVHSNLHSVEAFIEATLKSFARHAPRDCLLVFKHHPMDRGYCDYRRLIRRLARQERVASRVWYIHDQHLPTLLDHARGVVVINSTVGLQALHHGAPTMACGTAIYDLPGLTFQGELDEFWLQAPQARPDARLYQRFRSHLIMNTQLNGSFYRALRIPGSAAGLAWVEQGAEMAPEGGQAGSVADQPVGPEPDDTAQRAARR